MKRIPFGFIIIMLAVLWFLFQAVVSIYPTILWFGNLGFASVFWINFKAKLLTALVFGLLFFVIAGLNVAISRWLTWGSRAVRRDVESQLNIKRLISQLFGEPAGDGPGITNVTPDHGREIRTSLFWALGLLVVAVFMGRRSPSGR